MPTRSDLLLMTLQPTTVKAVATALSINGTMESDCLCVSLGDLLARLERQTVSAALIDVDAAPLRILAELEPIVARYPDIRFVVLASEARSDLILEAMQVGARHFLAKQQIHAELAGVLDRLVPKARAGQQFGALFTVTSASGGCGATTVAVNLAHELSLAAAATAVIVDLDVTYGAVSSYLGLEAPFGIADVLMQPDRVDSHLITTTAARFGERLLALLSPASTNPVGAINLQYANLDRTLEACQSAGAYTVVDAPRLAPEALSILFNASTQVLLVFQLTVKDLHRAKALVAGWRQQGLPVERVLGVVSRCQKRRPMIRLDEAQRVLGDVPLVCLANDFKAAVQAINFGQPLAEAAPRSELRRDLTALAQRVRQAEVSRVH